MSADGTFEFDFHELVVDSFAGGGGASTGIQMALGRCPDVAVNHDGEALAMHEANHPETVHIREDVWAVNPEAAMGYRQVGLLWASPDCKHFSKAKGGKPVSKKVRGLAWVITKWAAKVKPRVICMENVEEFQTYGPLMRRDGEWYPNPARKGEYFQRFIARLRKLGYVVEWRELRACDYGAPTIRKRLFLIARRDGLPIVWPEPTHGDPRKLPAKAGKLKPWRTAAECIDWSIPCPSIFERKKPLAEATLRRIARGVMRYVVNAEKPFIVRVDQTSAANRNGVGDIDAPLNTVHTVGSHAVVVPTLVGVGSRAGQSRERGVDEPTATTKTKYDTALVTAHLMTMRNAQKPFNGADEPTHTVTSGGAGLSLVAAPLQHATHGGRDQEFRSPVPTVTGAHRGELQVVAATIVQAAHGEGQPGGAQRWGSGTCDIERPAGTLTASNSHALVTAFLAQHNKERNGVKPGRDAREPVSTLCASGSHQQVVTASCVMVNTTGHAGAAADEPLPTVTTGGHHAEVRAFLIKYYGADQDPRLEEPMHTATTKHRFGLVTVHGELYQIVDIGMRMLTPRELANAQGFPPDYVIDRGANGKPLTKTAQVRMIGNSVCPPVAAAIVAANFKHEHAKRRRVAA